MAVEAPAVRPQIELRPGGPVEKLDSRLRGLAAVGAGGLALAGVYQLSGGRIGLPCILHATTGLNCPLCGTTRMAAALMRGDIGAAWAFNGPMTVIAPAAAVAVGYQYLAWGLERLRLARLPRIRLSRRQENVLTYALIAGLLVFGVLRNVV
jgi:hypothetical protein